MRGGLPNRTSSGRSMGECRESGFGNRESESNKRRSAVAVPTTANGQRSRDADRLELGDVFRAHAEHVAFLRFVAPDLHRRQVRIVAGNLAQVDAAADTGIVEDFRDRIRQAAGADVVDRDDRVGRAARPARIDDFLAAAFHLRVVALHRGEVELFGTRAGGHRRGCATTETDQHRRAAEHDHRIAVLQSPLFAHRERAARQGRRRS